MILDWEKILARLAPKPTTFADFKGKGYAG
jgi:hypothetical protein